MKSRILMAALVASLMSGCNSKRDCEKLQGEWRVDSGGGGSFEFFPPSTKGGAMRIIFSDGGFTVEEEQGLGKDPKLDGKGTFTCDDTKNPKQITFKFGGRTVVAIYEFNWGRLRICVGEDEKVPPTEFAGGAPRFKTPRPALLIFDRVK